jgi:hypothetical protein
VVVCGERRRCATVAADLQADEEAHVMQQWEYATAPLISHALQEILNNWGDEGYELVAVVDNVAYFKRPKQ